MDLPILSIPNATLFPKGILPVIVADPTYVQMIQDCVEMRMNIGVHMGKRVPIFNRYSEYVPEKIGVMGKATIVEELSDGSIKVFIRGIERIQLKEVKQNIPYPIYQVETLPDLEGGSLDTKKVAFLTDFFKRWVEETVPDFQIRQGDCSAIIDQLSVFLVKDIFIHRLLLENRSLDDRVQILYTLFRDSSNFKENPLAVEALKIYENLEK